MPAVTALEAPSHITKAISRAAKTTGADFDYLVKTALHESSFNHDAKAAKSSASGLFQFIEDTWLMTMKDQGAQYGLSKYSDKISQSSNGKYFVSDNAARKEILDLRNNPEIASVMAGAYSQQNSDYMQDKLGRAPSQGELYMAHFLGPSGAEKMIRMAKSHPNTQAAKAFPSAAKANPAIFKSPKGTRSMSEVYNLLVNKHGTKAVAQNEVSAKPAWSIADAKKTGPLVSMKAIAPASYYGALKKTSSSDIGVWDTIIKPREDVAQAAQKAQSAQTASTAIHKPSTILGHWALGREASSTPKHQPSHEEQWQANDGWNVKVSWADYSNPPGSQKNLKA